MTGIVTDSMIERISVGSDIRATPPSLRMSAGTRSRAMTAHAPASWAIRACSGVTTSMITPPFSIWASPALTLNEPFTAPFPLGDSSTSATIRFYAGVPTPTPRLESSDGQPGALGAFIRDLGDPAHSCWRRGGHGSPPSAGRPAKRGLDRRPFKPQDPRRRLHRPRLRRLHPGIRQQSRRHGIRPEPVRLHQRVCTGMGAARLARPFDRAGIRVPPAQWRSLLVQPAQARRHDLRQVHARRSDAPLGPQFVWCALYVARRHASKPDWFLEGNVAYVVHTDSLTNDLSALGV